MLKPSDARLGSAAFLFDPYLSKSDLKVWLVRDRNTRSGDFKASNNAAIPHRITINSGLEKDHFLIILAHEFAHYIAFSHYGRKIQPHGREWKDEFRTLLVSLINTNCLTPEITPMVLKHVRNPKASLSSDTKLYKALNHSRIPEGYLMLEEIPPMAMFALADGRRFQKMERRRTRYTCREIRTGRLYWVSALAPAKLLAS